MANKSGSPSLISLPKLINNDTYSGLKGVFCYVLEHYGHDGISCLISRDGDKILLFVGDWEGNTIDLDKQGPLNKLAYDFLRLHAEPLLEIVKIINLKNAIFYLSPKSDGKFVLVDVRTSLNKFIGPGMLNDVFGKIIETPKVLNIATLTTELYESIVRGEGKYSGDIILKPSKFRTIPIGSSHAPLYVEILR